MHLAPLGLGDDSCLNACRLAAQFYMIGIFFFFRILFKNTQELSNFLYMVPQPKPTEVTGKTPTVFSWHSDLSRVPYGLGYCKCLWECVTISVLLEGLSCCIQLPWNRLCPHYQQHSYSGSKILQFQNCLHVGSYSSIKIRQWLYLQ